MSSNRRLNSRSPLRNKFRRNKSKEDLPGKTRKKTKKLESKLKKRSVRDKIAARLKIRNRIKRPAQLSVGQMSNKARNVNVAGTNQAMVQNDITAAYAIESNDEANKIRAFRFDDGDVRKLYIENLGDIEDSDFGITDTVNAIIESAGLTTNEHYEVYIAANSQKEIDTLSQRIQADERLKMDTSFVRTDGRASEGAVTDQVDDNDDQLVDLATRPKEVMSNRQFRLLMDAEPKGPDFFGRERSVKYNDVLTALDNYHNKVDAYRKELEENNKDDILQFEIFSGEINELAVELIEKIDVYKEETTTGRIKVKKSGKKEAMQVLRDQVANASRGKYNVDLAFTRESYWRDNLNALTNLDIDFDANEIVLGEGAQGEVRSVTFHGNPPFVAGVKMDDNTKINWEAVASGIPKENPQQAKRSVATYEVNRFLGMDIIPETRFFVREDEATGIKEFGQAMQVIHGTDGQIKIKGEELEKSLADTVLEGLRANIPQGDFIVDMEQGKVWRPLTLVVDIDYTNTAIQKGLADLQLLDNIIGHADRHPGNFIFQTASADSRDIIGVKGIDNDDTHGQDWNVSGANTKFGSKTPGLPPVIDINTAVNILKLNANSVEQLKDRLSLMLPTEDVDKEVLRIMTVRQGVSMMVREKRIAITENEEPTQEQFQILLAETTGNVADLREDLLTWGPDTYALQGEKNSYLGNMIARKDPETEGTTEAVWK